MEKKKGYNWNFSSVGGSVRVKISSGQDIAHLGELDRKLWTVLGCPVEGLEFDAETLALIDTNGDGKIRLDEVVSTAQWLTSSLKDPDLLLKEDSSIALTDFAETENGVKLSKSARQILLNLGLDKDEISLDDTADNEKIFADTRFNGDGIITPASALDEDLKALIEKAVGAVGSVKDRSGAQGIDTDRIEAFYAACADYSAWKAAGVPEIFPYGDDTEAALAACQALEAKIADYFMRCKLIGFNSAAAEALDVSVEKIGAISGGDLSVNEDIATYPLARPSAEGLLPVSEGLNPAWKAAMASLKALVLDKDYPDKKAITEQEWNAVLAKFGPYMAWKADKKGEAVEPLGLEEVEKILKEDRKGELLSLVEEDKKLEEEALGIESVHKFQLLYKNFYRFLNNYVSFTDFYDKEHKAIFQAGTLFIDQRSTELCVKVQDLGKVGDISALSGMYILVCSCTSKVKGQTINIAAVLTDGDTGSLRVGRNAVFYDRDGLDWDATVTQIIDNPLSLRQAFWAPYKKIGKWFSDKLDKGASDKNDKAMENALSGAESASADPQGGAAAIKSKFDIAQFAGIFAAIGMALGFLASALVSILKGAYALGFWKVLLIILAIMLVISAPSVFMTWRRLRRRDLGPVLNANGWAINARALVTVPFGRTLTQLAKYPKLSSVDPAERKKKRRRRLLGWTLGILLVLGAGAALYLTNHLAFLGLARDKAEATEEVVEVVEETAPESVSEAETAVVEEVAE